MGRQICAWCKAYLGPFDGDGVTHGICEPCYEAARSKPSITGRMASSNPAMQNIPIRTPEGRRIRDAFTHPTSKETSDD